ncbi:hypothetical protein L6452_22488 [Arctium lappa]|uniref:Uncharacterized protein n=1 Tax=Arctium lappa TaxID=4217 RepID=A0ACB9AZI5_ARCLA|nr:hypothetical protein L6452_22488 [Arctium lappa]
MLLENLSNSWNDESVLGEMFVGIRQKSREHDENFAQSIDTRARAWGFMKKVLPEKMGMGFHEEGTMKKVSPEKMGFHEEGVTGKMGFHEEGFTGKNGDEECITGRDGVS